MNQHRDKLEMASQRLEGLGDGIFSVAMTIMAIELTMPIVKGNDWKDFSEALKASWDGLLCYVISFIVLGIMWFGHRMIFEYIGKTNRYFIFLGILFYMVVCLVPFSTRILANNTLKWFAIFMYGINLSLCNLILYAQWSYGLKRPALLHSAVPGEIKKEARILFLLSPFVYFIAIGCSFFAPRFSICIFVATPLVYLLPNKIDKYLP